MATTMLPVPAEFFGSALWRDVYAGRAYLDLQYRADEQGFVTDFSERRAESWWRVSRRQVSRILAHLEDEALVAYPDGRRGNAPYTLQLADPWRVGAASQGVPAANADSATPYGDIPAAAYQQGVPAANGGMARVSSIISLQAYQQREGAGEEQGDVSGERASETAESVPAENGVAASFPVGFEAEAYQQNGAKRASEEEAAAKTPSPSPSPSLSPTPPIPTPTPTPSPSDSFVPLRSTKESAAAGAGGDQPNEEAGGARRRREPERPRRSGRSEPEQREGEQGELLPGVAEEAARLEEEKRERSLQRFVTLLSELGLDGTTLTGKAYAKQAAVLSRMIEAHGHDDVETAMRGMGGIYPFSSGDPWDALTLERRFVEALASGRKIERAKLSGDVSELPEPERARARAQRAEEERRRIAEDEEAHREAVAAWRERISGRLAAEERAVKLRFWKEAERAYDDLPLRVDDSKRRAFIIELALANYGAAVGDPPPRLERSR